jgi:hypothetical protein
MLIGYGQMKILNLNLTWVCPDHDYQDPYFIVNTPFSLAGITVPEGFRTDGTSLPRISRIIFNMHGKYMPAAIIHDFCLLTDKSKAAHYFRLALEEQGVSKIVIASFYTFTKAYWFIKLRLMP